MTALPVRLSRVTVAYTLLGWMGAALVLQRDAPAMAWDLLWDAICLRCGLVGLLVGMAISPLHAWRRARPWSGLLLGPLAVIGGMWLYFRLWPPQSWVLPAWKFVLMYLDGHGAILLPLGAATGVAAIRWAHRPPRFRIGLAEPAPPGAEETP